MHIVDQNQRGLSPGLSFDKKKTLLNQCTITYPSNIRRWKIPGKTNPRSVQQLDPKNAISVEKFGMTSTTMPDSSTTQARKMLYRKKIKNLCVSNLPSTSNLLPEKILFFSYKHSHSLTTSLKPHLHKLFWSREDAIFVALRVESSFKHVQNFGDIPATKSRVVYTGKLKVATQSVTKIASSYTTKIACVNGA